MKRSWLRQISVPVWIMIVVVVLAGCQAGTGGTSTPGPTATSTVVAATSTPEADLTATVGTGGESDLAGTEWQLVSFGPADAPTEVIAGSEITLNFDENGQATGSGGCNTYNGGYRIKGTTVTFSDVVRTLRACAQEDRTQQETRFFEALENAKEYQVTGGELTITYDDEGVMRWEKV